MNKPKPRFKWGDVWVLSLWVSLECPKHWQDVMLTSGKHKISRLARDMSYLTNDLNAVIARYQAHHHHALTHVDTHLVSRGQYGLTKVSLLSYAPDDERPTTLTIVDGLKDEIRLVFDRYQIRYKKAV